MKISDLKYVALFCGVSLMIGCSESSADSDVDNEEVTTDAPITLSTDSLTASDEGATIEVTSEGGWSVSSNRSWCEVSLSEGSGNASFNVTFDANSESRARSAEIVVANSVDTCRVAIAQAEGVYTPGMHYKIPIVFQIFYTRESNTAHYLTQEQIYELYDHVVGMYANCGQDLGFEFVLAEEDENGVTLEEPGISRNKTTLASIAYKDFMYDAYNDYTEYMWDPSKYINISVYEFSGISNPVGISQSAYLMQEHAIDGVVSLDVYAEPTELLFPMCLSINNTYVGTDGSIDSEFIDLKSTLGHELGHMLGLKHVFYENSVTGSTAGGDDTDYCTDTPTYNRLGYNEDFTVLTYNYFNGYTTVKPTDEELLPFYSRTATNVTTPYIFESTNIMDYSLGYFTTFSQEQVERMRLILEYSPYIPGCKAVDFSTYTKTRSEVQVPIELHICK